MEEKTRRGAPRTRGERETTGEVTPKPERRRPIRRSPTPGTRRGEATRPSSHETAHPVGEPHLRVAALGGFEEIGRNMMFLEYEDEIIVLDAGLQFPEEETPGIDYIIPNTEYLEKKKGHVRALIITHAHYDHFGAVPYALHKMGNPPIYATALTKALIERRQQEFLNAPKIDFRVVKNGDTIAVSKHFTVEFFDVAHNVPDTTGVIIKTPIGNMAHFADFKVDYDQDDNPKNLDIVRRVGAQGIHTLFIDSTGAETPGRTLSERVVEKNLEELFGKSEGRIIIGMFASLITRIAEILKIAERMGKKVAFSGRSMKENVEAAQNLGYIKVKKGTVVPLEEIHKYHDTKVMVLATGAQGEPNASMMRIVNGEHRQITIKKSDTVIFSASVIPGNERSVQTLKDNLARQGARVYHSKIFDIHSSGHAPQEELKTIMTLTKPRFLIPVHGYYFMRAMNKQNAMEVGIPENRIFLPNNGEVTVFTKDAVRVTEETVPASYVLVDGLGVGDVGEVVLRDRRLLAEEGMIVIIATVGRRDGRLLKNPDIISRGFIYLKENQRIVDEVREHIKNIFGRIPRNQPQDGDYLRGMIRDQIGQYVFTKTNRRPMILPVIIEL